MRDARIRRIALMTAPRDKCRAGPWGWASLVLDDAVGLDAKVMRRTQEGEWTRSLPDRSDRAGVVHGIVHPLDHHVRRAIETQVIADLRQRGCLL